MKNDTDSLSHLIKSIELFSIILKNEDYITEEKILSELDSFREENSPLSEKTARRCIDTIHKILGEEIIESKRNKGYRIKRKNLNQPSWIAPLFSRYLIHTNTESLDYFFSPLTKQVGIYSLYNLFLLNYALKKRLRIKIRYVKYRENTESEKTISVYALVQRGVKLVVLAKENGNWRQFLFIGINKITILDEHFPKESKPTLVKEFYENSIGIYQSEKIEPVKIRFSPEAKNFIFKELFQSKQIIEEQKDGSFLLSLLTADKQEVFNITSNFMKYAELIEPKKWRNEFLEEIHTFFKRHQKKDNNEQ